jgi:hypothetical protein
VETNTPGRDKCYLWNSLCSLPASYGLIAKQP